MSGSHHKAPGFAGGYLLGALMLWLEAVFFFFGIITPASKATLFSLAIGAFSMAMAVSLTIEYEMPFEGFMTISTDVLKEALTKI
jgi:hypothetical protein